MANPPPEASPLTMQQFIEIGRLPDFIRDLQQFDGKPKDLLVWLTDVEGIFRLYRDAGATESQINLIERSVRRKIKGEAADVLNSNNIVHDWAQIKNTLLLYYKDKRDLKTLDYELTSIKKNGNETLGSYYSRVNELLSSIVAQVQTEEKFFLHADSHINFFREKAIDAFIRGLEKPLCQLLKTFNPKTLNHAYHFCLDYYNMDSRSAPFRNEHTVHNPKPRDIENYRLPPRPPPRRLPIQPPVPAPRNFGFPQMAQFNRQQFQPNSYFQTRPQFQQNYQNSFSPPPRPFMPKPQPRPEPMDIDHSVRSRNINYGNRPQIDLKRPFPLGSQQHPFKRQAHPIDTGCENDYFDNEFDNDQNFDTNQYYDEYPDSAIQSAETDVQISNLSQVQQEEQMPSTSTNFLDWNPSW